MVLSTKGGWEALRTGHHRICQNKGERVLPAAVGGGQCVCGRVPWGPTTGVLPAEDGPHQTSAQTPQAGGEAKLPAAEGQILPAATSWAPCPIPGGTPAPPRSAEPPPGGGNGHPATPPGQGTQGPLGPGWGWGPCQRPGTGTPEPPGAGRGWGPCQPPWTGSPPHLRGHPPTPPQLPGAGPAPPSGSPSGPAAPARPSRRRPVPSRSVPSQAHLALPGPAGPCRAGAGEARRAGPGRGGRAGPAPKAVRGSPRAGTSTRSLVGWGAAEEQGVPESLEGRREGPSSGGHGAPGGAGESRGARAGGGVRGPSEGPRGWEAAASIPWCLRGPGTSAPLPPQPQPPLPRVTGAVDALTHHITASAKLPTLATLPEQRGGVPGHAAGSARGFPDRGREGGWGSHSFARGVISVVPILCPKSPLGTPHQWLPAVAGGAGAAGTCYSSQGRRKMLFTLVLRHRFTLQVALLPSGGRAMGPGCAQGLFLQLSRALPRTARRTLTPGGAEHTENGLPCPHHLASLSPPRLLPCLVQGPVVMLAWRLTQQLLPPAVRLPLDFDIRCPRPAPPEVFTAPALHPALPPASTAPAASHCSPAAFLAPSGSPGLDCTIPKLGPNFPPTLAICHLPPPSPPPRGHPRTKLWIQVMFMSKRQAITLWQEHKYRSRVPVLALPGPSQLPWCLGATPVALSPPALSTAPKRGVRLCPACRGVHRHSAPHQCLRRRRPLCSKLSVAGWRVWVWGAGAPAPRGRPSLGWGGPRALCRQDLQGAALQPPL